MTPHFFPLRLGFVILLTDRADINFMIASHNFPENGWKSDRIFAVAIIL